MAYTFAEHGARLNAATPSHRYSGWLHGGTREIVVLYAYSPATGKTYRRETELKNGKFDGPGWEELTYEIPPRAHWLGVQKAPRLFALEAHKARTAQSG